MTQRDYADRTGTVYLCYDASDVLLYVGITDKTISRFQGHEVDKYWWDEVATIRLEHLPNRTAALARESELIHNNKPRYNLDMNEAVNAPAPRSQRFIGPAYENQRIKFVQQLLIRVERNVEVNIGGRSIMTGDIGAVLAGDKGIGPIALSMIYWDKKDPRKVAKELGCTALELKTALRAVYLKLDAEFILPAVTAVVNNPKSYGRCYLRLKPISFRD